MLSLFTTLFTRPYYALRSLLQSTPSHKASTEYSLPPPSLHELEANIDRARRLAQITLGLYYFGSLANAGLLVAAGAVEGDPARRICYSLSLATLTVSVFFGWSRLSERFDAVVDYLQECHDSITGGVSLTSPQIVGYNRHLVSLRLPLLSREITARDLPPAPYPEIVPVEAPTL